GDSGERSATPHGKGEGNRKHGHYNGDQRVGQLVPKRDAQPHSVKTALPEIANVSIKLAKVHFLRLQAFLGEIRRLFVDFSERSEVEFLIPCLRCALEVALPSILESPRAGPRIPVRARGKNSPRDRKRGWIEFKNREIRKLVCVGIEKLVIENSAG